MSDSDERDGDGRESDDRESRQRESQRVAPPRDTPGGPYFGRLLIVLLLAVAFCAFMTWLLSSTLPD